jgi:thiamine-phosphate diphosphorylase/hydroxyethylthiazole kinase
MSIKKIDYSLYLVTDRSLVPEGKSFLGQIERALEGGTTLVQLREKDTDTGAFIDFALQVKELTRRFEVPLIINDRLDVALAIDAEGVHIGQDDMPLKEARRILGPKKIIGVSCNNEEEAAIAIADGADYLGIGAVWFTSTKKNIKEPMGIQGLQRKFCNTRKDGPLCIYKLNIQAFSNPLKITPFLLLLLVVSDQRMQVN